MAQTCYWCRWVHDSSYFIPISSVCIIDQPLASAPAWLYCLCSVIMVQLKPAMWSWKGIRMEVQRMDFPTWSCYVNSPVFDVTLAVFGPQLHHLWNEKFGLRTCVECGGFTDGWVCNLQLLFSVCSSGISWAKSWVSVILGSLWSSWEQSSAPEVTRSAAWSYLSGTELSEKREVGTWIA